MPFGESKKTRRKSQSCEAFGQNKSFFRGPLTETVEGLHYSNTQRTVVLTSVIRKKKFFSEAVDRLSRSGRIIYVVVETAKSFDL